LNPESTESAYYGWQVIVDAIDAFLSLVILDRIRFHRNLSFN